MVFGFLVQKTLAVPIFKVLASQVILCTKIVVFECCNFAAVHAIYEIFKMQYFGNCMELQAQIFRIV